MDRYEILGKIEDLLDRGLNDLCNEEFEFLLENVEELIKNYD